MFNGSYKDNCGIIVKYNNEIFRLISESGYKIYSECKSEKIYSELCDLNYIEPFEESKREILNILNKEFNYKAKIVIKHKKIDYISYPYEWSFDQLKKAALFHLNFHLFLLEKNFTLRDATAYNIQFNGSKPIFIDTLSIKKYSEGEYWEGHRQFCNEFLNPLLISSKTNISFNDFYKGSLNGISTEDTTKILKFFNFLSPTVFFNVFLQNKLQKKAEGGKKEFQKKLFPKKTFIYLLKSLKHYIQNLNQKKTFSTWADYSKDNTYSKESHTFKQEILKKYIEENNIKKLGDFGCNDGEYSEIACKHNVKVVGFDFDVNAINNSFLRAETKNLDFLPLKMDLSNPSSNIGWNQAERQGLKERFSFDGVICFAIIHHLVIAKNIPLDQVLNFFINFGNTGLIEFIPIEDETIQVMMQHRENIFDNYNQINFEKYLEKRCTIKKKLIIKNSMRIIYEYARKN